MWGGVLPAWQKTGGGWSPGRTHQPRTLSGTSPSAAGSQCLRSPCTEQVCCRGVCWSPGRGCRGLLCTLTAPRAPLPSVARVWLVSAPTRLCHPRAEHAHPSLCPPWSRAHGRCSLRREGGPCPLEASRRLRRDFCTGGLCSLLACPALPHLPFTLCSFTQQLGGSEDPRARRHSPCPLKTTRRHLVETQRG